jgi:diguanylate cyclase (GGDEF)-like protein
LKVQAERRKKLKAIEARVLLVDSNPEQLDATSQLLRDGGMRVAAVSRPDAAGALFKAFSPDVIVIATRAPQMDGVEMGRQLHKSVKGALPIIYIIDAPDPELRQYCLLRGSGVDALSRPLHADELVAKVLSQAKLRASLEREAKRAHAEGTGQDLQDKATGIFNRATLGALLTHEIKRGQRHGDNVALLLVGLNNHQAFKKRFGREMAERLLVYTSLVVRESVRESDAVGRLNEATFGIMLPKTRSEDVQPVLKRLTARFAAARFQLGGQLLRPSVAMGAASFPETVGGANGLLAAAELELTRSRHGQDSVTGLAG